jgi:hypothetical protein
MKPSAWFGRHQRIVPHSEHSYISYRSKLADSVTTVADVCGNSPEKIERNYRKKGITVEAAQDFFSILPPAEPINILPLSQPEAEAEPGSAIPVER